MIQRISRIAAALTVVGSLGCNKITDPPKTPDPAVLPGLTSISAPSQAPGDGVSLVRIVATIDTSLKGDARTVKFNTTAGIFGDKNEVSVRADTAGLAVAMLRAPLDSVLALVTAVAGPTALRTEIRFIPTRAERIDVDPSAFAIEASPGKEITVTATLRRAIGTPSAGASVTFSATDSTGASIGHFSSAPPSNAAGTVTTRYSVDGTTYRGAVTITATTAGTNGQITGTTSIQVITPK